MEGLARYYPHLIQVTLVLLQGLGAGVIAADVVAWKLYSSPRLESARRATPQIATAPRKPELLADLRGLLRRNIFCAACEPITLDDLSVALGDPGQPPPMASLEGAELVGTMVVESKPKDSMATVALTSHPEAKFVLLSEGDALGEAVVVSIESKRVIFMQDGQEKVLNLFGEVKISPVVATATTPPAAAKPEDNQIRQVGPYKYEVDKSVINDFMKNMASASSGAQVLPDPKGGFKVSFVRSFSVFYKLGIRSGDTISSVNNIQLDSIDQTFALYTKLKDANHLTLSVNRGGQTINMDYDIR
jgi:general secretion pathway protein C